MSNDDNGCIRPPFTPEQVQRLNEGQTNTGDGMIHPYTCRYRSEKPHGHVGGDLGVMIATRDGWVCPYCDYTQEWAASALLERRNAGPMDRIELSLFELTPGEHIDLRISEYKDLAARGARGADVMLECLLRRKAELG